MYYPMYCLVYQVKLTFKTNLISPVENISKNEWKLPPIKDILETNSLASLSTLWNTIFCLLLIWVIHFVVNFASPDILSIYPFQVLIHFNLHGNRFVYNLWAIFLFLSKSNIRRSVVRKMQEQLLRLKDILGLT